MHFLSYCWGGEEGYITIWLVELVRMNQTNSNVIVNLDLQGNTAKEVSDIVPSYCWGGGRGIYYHMACGTCKDGSDQFKCDCKPGFAG